MSKKLYLTFAFLFVFASVAFCQNDTQIKNTVIQNGVGLGTVIAVAISWSRNNSILWAIIHGILGWLYVIYYYFTRK